MSDSPARYMFAGHVIGAQARFHRLDDASVNEVVPAVGTAALAPTGGRSANRLEKPFRHDVNHPRRRCLLEVEKADAWVEGRDPEGSFETELFVDVSGVHVLEKFHLDHVRLHLLAVRNGMDGASAVSTRGSVVEGLRMGNVTARITFDDEPLAHTGSQEQLATFYRGRDAHYRKEHGWRFHTTADGNDLANDHGHHRFTLVRRIELEGPEADKQSISVTDNLIYWKGFGRIILGEVHVKGQDRRVNLVRLAMGSDGGGSGTSGGGGSNGTPTTG
jgi:hypothetical protein